MSDRAVDDELPKPASFAAPVVLYTTRWCGFCSAALELLRTRGIEFANVAVDGKPSARAWLREASGQTTVPQVFVRGESIGGYTELAALERSGGLGERLHG